MVRKLVNRRRSRSSSDMSSTAKTEMPRSGPPSSAHARAVRSAWRRSLPTVSGPRSPAVVASSQLNLLRGDLVGDGAGVAWHGGRVRVDLVGQQLPGAGDAGDRKSTRLKSR